MKEASDLLHNKFIAARYTRGKYPKEVSTMKKSIASFLYKPLLILMGAMILVPSGVASRAQAATRGDTLQEDRAEKELNHRDVDEVENERDEMDGEGRHGRHRGHGRGDDRHHGADDKDTEIEQENNEVHDNATEVEDHHRGGSN
jgi:hypothetical protein